MTDSIRQQVEDTLRSVEDPFLRTNLHDAGVVRRLDVDDSSITLEVNLGYPAGEWRQQLEKKLHSVLSGLAGKINVQVSQEIAAHAVQSGVKRMPKIKNIIAIASGKGGVGKSTTAANVALALHASGAKVGILDADIYGPSQPRMLGCSGKPEVTADKNIVPQSNHGVQSMSIGYLIEEDTPMVWRGPMATSALQQLLNETKWDDLDYMIVDLPPGTGDIQLTLAQKIPVSGAVIVTTPQDISLIDAVKALKMFEKVKIPVLGVVENMSTYICPGCGREEQLFGSGGGEHMQQKYNTTLLGKLPLDPQIRIDADNGCPSVVADRDSAVSAAYTGVARRIAALLSMRGKDYSAKFPRIVVKND
ncbi:MAG: iron-sulfur cluster carrier protein ApbC [Candidatus Porifericomitaceae bacterium WSBS_2022_MAG_OTU9]